MTITSHNNTFQAIAEQQDIPAGSNQWRRGGNHPFSGQTGAHSSYGWRHDHKLEGGPAKRDLYVRSVIANYGMRPCYYTGAPKRHSGYRIGGRPEGYQAPIGEPKPDFWDNNDRPNGERIVDGVLVSGPDLQHFWLDPLLAIIDHTTDDDRVQIHTGAFVPARDVARLMVAYLVDSMSGMLRKDGQWLGGGRAAARVIDTYVEVALTRPGLIHEDDAIAMGTWLETYGLPALENAPGVQEAKSGSGGCNWYQCCGWLLPPLWNLAKVTQGELQQRVEAVIRRTAQWMLDIDQIAGGAGKWERLDITPQMRAGVDGKALPTLLGTDVTAAHIYGQWNFSLWSVRAADVVQRIHDSAEADAFFERVKKAAFAEAGSSVDNKAWLVDAENGWLVE